MPNLNPKTPRQRAGAAMPESCGETSVIVNTSAPCGDNVQIFDRLPTHGLGLFNLPPMRSFYHTQRAEAARQRAEVEVPEELADARRVLVAAGLRRHRPQVPDEADHNAMTLAHAQRYADLGFSVIDSHAIHPQTGKGTFIDGSAKLPRGSAWNKRISTDRDEINDFWTGRGRYPTKTGEEGRKYAKVNAVRNVSIAFPPGCNLFVLDIDGEAGKANLAKLEAEYGPLPKTAKSISGSGGAHYIFRTSRPILNTASAIAPGIDIRGEGGQIIAPPSVHKTGNYYCWEDGCAPWDGIEDAPDWLEELAVAASKKGKPSTQRKARAALGKIADSEQDPISDQGRPQGCDEWLEVIGDNEGGRGFDNPIYVAAICYFGDLAGEPDEGDFLDLKELLRDRILDAECKDDRAKTRYATDGYLDQRIAQAWDYIRKQPDEEASDEDDEADRDEVRAILRKHLEQRDGETIIAADAAQVATDHLIAQGAAEGDARDVVAEAVADVQRHLAIRAEDKDRDPKWDAQRERAVAETGEAFPSILAPLYDEKLVTPSGFMVSPTDKPKLYKKYKIDPKNPGAETFMRSEIRDQIIHNLKDRVSYVVLDGEARWAIPGGRGEPVRLWKEQTLAKLYVNRGVSYREGDGEKAKVQQIKPAEVFTFARERDTFFDTCFEPDPKKAGIAKRKGAYNLWTGFAAKPVEGNWSKLRDHIRHQICGGDEAHFNWFMTWIASVFARPGVKIPSSIAITGEQGTGKSKVFDWIRRAIGSAALKVSAGKHLTGTFNAHLDGKIFLTCEEAFWAGSKADGGVLKDLITSDTLQIEGKFMNMVERPNYVNVVFISNNKWVVPTDNDDARRFFVLDCLPTRKQDAAFFGAIDDEMENGGLDAMVYELMNWKPELVGLTWDSLRNPPVTEALRQQAGMGLSGPAGALVNCIEAGEIAGQTKDGEPFRYELLEDQAIDVSRPHLYAALGGHDSRGDVAAQVRDAVETFFGKDADGGENKRKIKYVAQNGTEGGDERETMSRYVTVPALCELRDALSRYGRGGAFSDLADDREASAAA